MGADELMDRQHEARTGEVSKRMAVVIVMMLLVIMVPVALVGLPMSKIVVTVTNMDSQTNVHVVVSVSDAPDGQSSFDLGPEEPRTVSFTVAVGRHGVNVWYTYEGQWYARHEAESCGVSLLETEEAEFSLYSPYANATGFT